MPRLCMSVTTSTIILHLSVGMRDQAGELVAQITTIEFASLVLIMLS